MKKALIWDLDGTLVDSYGEIVSGLTSLAQACGIKQDKEEIYREVKKTSVRAYIAQLSTEIGISREILKARYSQHGKNGLTEISLMPHCKEVLMQLTAAGVENYIFTHRGGSTVPLLQMLKLDSFFLDVITSENNFPRKPDPSALHYLIKKHGLSPDATCYVGDREIDACCAENAGIPGIILQEKGNRVSTVYPIWELREIPEIVRKLPNAGA